jgi:hypothetical protein
MHFDPTTGSTIGAEATALATYYQCLKGTYCKMEFASIGAKIREGFENTLELKPKKYKKAMNKPDGKAWEKETENEHDHMVKMISWNQ